MQKFVTPAPISAVLDVPAGRVRFVGADRADTTVEVLPADAAKERDVKAARRVTVAYGDGVLRIGVPAGEGRLRGASGSVEVTVRLPAGSRVEARVADADVRGVGRLGEVVLEAARGVVKLDEADSARIVLAAGDIAVGRLGGAAEIGTRQGDIRIAEAVRGAVEVRTEAGDIAVGAAHGVSATLDAGTGHGRIHNALLNTEGAAAGLSIRATTAHGDITARSL
ncbi:DUF4097 family beta strand repeat-containing protein [Streptomyces kanasensis]|uniref:DUF4097 family beta strand repeat-containing protein n=1 Tax=Streptomyces kanasensis TaxID=936756 RepID=UPI0037008D01